MRPGDKILIEAEVKEIKTEKCYSKYPIVIDGAGIDQRININKDAVYKSEADIRKEAMEQMYEVIKYLLKHEADGGAGVDDFVSMFGVASPGVEELSDYTADEFYNKVSEYMAIHSFNVGDLVYIHDDVDEPGVITRIDNSGWLSVLWYDGSCGDHEYQNLKKYTNTKKFNKIFELLSEMIQEVKK